MSKASVLADKLIHPLKLTMNTQGFFASMKKKHGETFFVHMPGLNQVLFTSESDIIDFIFDSDHDTLTSSLPSPLSPILGDHSLILLQGNDHKTARKSVKPFFQGESLYKYSGYIQDCVSQALIEMPKTIDVQDWMKEVTLNVIFSAVFGLNSENDRTAFKQRVLQLLKRFSPVIMLAPQSRISCFGLSHWDAFLRCKDSVDQLIFEEIEKRAKKEPEDNIIDQLVHSYINEDKPISLDDKKIIRDHLITFLLAGHETTANTLTWCIYYLAKDESLQQQLRQELLLEQTSKIIKSPILDSVIKETMRLHPVVPLVMRSVVKPIDINGVTLPADSYLGVATFNVHYNEAVFPAPDQFDHTRFIDKKYLANQYLPFGGGDKKCLGYGMALLEMKLMLSSIVKHYSFKLQKPDQKVNAKIEGITMGFNQVMRVDMEPVDQSRI